MMTAEWVTAIATVAAALATAAMVSVYVALFVVARRGLRQIQEVRQQTVVQSYTLFFTILYAEDVQPVRRLLRDVQVQGDLCPAGASS